MDEIQKMNDGTYHFTSPNIAPIFFFKFKGSMHVYNGIRKCDISTEKAEEDQIKFNSRLSKIILSNPKYVKIYQSDTFRKY